MTQTCNVSHGTVFDDFRYYSFDGTCGTVLNAIVDYFPHRSGGAIGKYRIRSATKLLFFRSKRSVFGNRRQYDRRCFSGGLRFFDEGIFGGKGVLRPYVIGRRVRNARLASDFVSNQLCVELRIRVAFGPSYFGAFVLRVFYDFFRDLFLGVYRGSFQTIFDGSLTCFVTGSLHYANCGGCFVLCRRWTPFGGGTKTLFCRPLPGLSS